jgi:ABC-type Fe3+ transport system permease subunit
LAGGRGDRGPWDFGSGAAALLALAGLVGLLLLLPRADLVGNSLLVVGGAMGLGLTLGGMAGWLLGWTDLPGRRWWMALVLAWAMTPLIVQLAAWDSLWGRLSWLSALHQVNYAPWFRGVPAVVWVQGCACIPWVALLVMAARFTVSGSVEDEAQLLMPVGQVFYRVTLPQHRSLWWVLAAVVGLRVFEQIEVSDVYQVRTWPEVWYLGFALGQFEGWGSGNPLHAWWDFLFGLRLSDQAWGTGARLEAGGLPIGLARSLGIAGALGALVLGGGISLLRGLQRWLRVLPNWDWLPHRRLRMVAPGIWQGYLVVTILVPLLIIVSNLVIRGGLRVAHTQGQVDRHWSLVELAHRLGMAATDYRDPMLWSWLIGFVAAVVVWGLGLAWAWRQSRPGLAGRRLGRLGMILVATISLATPAPLVSLGWYRLLNFSQWDWLHQAAQVSILGPVLALAFKQLGFAILFWWVVLRQQPPAWREDMCLQGVPGGVQFWHLAIRAPAGVHILFLAVVTLMGAGDLSTSFATLPPGLDTFPRRLLGDLHAGASGQVAAACLLQIGLVLIVAGTSAIWGRGRVLSESR